MYINVVYSSLSLALKTIMNVGLFFVLARLLTPLEFGVISTAYSLAIISSAMAEYGYNFLVLRELHKKQIEDIYWKILIQKMGISFAVSLIIWLYTYLFYGDNEYYSTVLLISLSGVVLSFTVYNSTAIKAINIFVDETKILALQLLVFVCSALFFSIDEPINAYSFSVSFILSRLCAAIYSFSRTFQRFPVRKEQLKGLHLDQKFIFEQGSYYGMHIIFAIAYFQIDTQVMNHLLGAEVVGIYQNSIRLIVVGMLASEVILQVFLPALTKSFLNNKENFVVLAKKATIVLSTIVLAYITVLVSYKESIILLLYGEGYSSIASYTWIVALIVFLRSLGSIYGLSLSLSDRALIRFLSVFTVFILSLLLNFIFLPIYGYEASFYIQIVIHIVLNVLYVLATFMVIGSTIVSKALVVITIVFSLVVYISYTNSEFSSYLIFALPLLALLFFSSFNSFRRTAKIYDLQDS